ncbi:hypothetical protein J15TS10_35850 [Paenibacillus woosongensis]|uniref:Uncharacterized protein n=1 Tax=Paenibacillus woosongensis TaxID=307580 RepID=A0ABQ4MV49_9BACL|nr:hypothetical protein J15TS10_35850 [Paenibacillus woosongensis]
MVVCHKAYSRPARFAHIHEHMNDLAGRFVWIGMIHGIACIQNKDSVKSVRLVFL